MGQVLAGTSGFAYKSWKPAFYPADLPAKRFLEHYSARLNCLEVNYTFRRLLTAKVAGEWIAQTPPAFVFALKAPMRITHVLRLKNADESVRRFLESIEPLREAHRLGPLLFQLPPNLGYDRELLCQFLGLLPPVYRCAFEFRNPSWFNEDLYSVLRQRKIALCAAESDKLQSPVVETADFAYFRLRKPPYSNDDLRRIASEGRRLMKSSDVFLIFKHEEDPGGALEAEKVLELVRATGAEV